MKPKINYHYSIPFVEVSSFDWNTTPIDITTYRDKIVPKIPRIVQTLHKEYNNRQAVIVVNGEEDFMSCLLTIQFQKIDSILYVIANYRSQCKKNGRPNDSLMLQYISSIIMRATGLTSYNIQVNVGNYHVNNNIK